MFLIKSLLSSHYLHTYAAMLVYIFCILLWLATDMSKVTVHCCQDCLLGTPNVYLHLLVMGLPNIYIYAFIKFDNTKYQFFNLYIHFADAKYLRCHIGFLRTKCLMAIVPFGHLLQPNYSSSFWGTK